MRRTVLLLMLAGCSGTDREPPVTCDPAKERVGTYLMSFKEEPGGTCGQYGAGLTTLAPGGNVEPGCEVTYERVSEAGCKVERSMKCSKIANSSQGPIATDYEAVIVSTQKTDDGSRLEGMMMFAYREQGYSCRSTYAITAVRQ